MDGSTGKLIHIGAEFIVLLGVTFYMNSQVRSLKAEIRELRAKIEEDTRETNKHLNSMYMVIDQLQKARTHPSIEEAMYAGKIPPWLMARGHEAHQHSKNPTNPIQPMQLRNRKHPLSSHKIKTKPIVKFQEEEQVQSDENSLDEELRDELKAIEDDDETENAGQLEAPNTENEHTNEVEDESDETSNTKSQTKKQLKEVEGPFSDLSFVQSAIRQVPRKQNPSHSTQKKP